MITREQTAEVLEVVAHYDGRRVTNPMVDTWHEQARRAKWHVTDALNAVHAHFAESKKQIYPLDITERIRAVKNLPPYPERAGERKQAHTVHADPNCTLCDEYGWVNDSEDKYGWAIRCRHDPNQLLTPKPKDTYEAARQIRAGRALEAETPGYYRRAHDVPDPSEPRTRGRPS